MSGDYNYVRADLYDTLRAENERLREAHTVLWAGMAMIVELRTEYPNATVRRMLEIAEEALNDDPVSEAARAALKSTE